MSKKVAVVAASCRFPGADERTFWPALMHGRNLITEADTSRWSHAEFLHPDKANPGTAYTFAAGTLGDISGFDAGFFNISPREAGSMDPQQRILLEMAWELFENAGIKPSSLRGSDCGVYLGVASVDYGYRLAEDMAAIDAGSATGNTSSIVANRLSYFYDLRGPSMSIDTACSSSLVAFHQACQAISNGDISQAVTGGISLHLHPFGFLVFSKASMLSRTGQCHVFDASADGYVRSEGGGLFLLKDYDQAVADGNPILAIVAGSAVNTDGRKSSLTLPSAEAQINLIQRAYTKAGISADQIDYLEAHGTGTPVGDPIETLAIGKAIAMQRRTPLPIGSVKSNLGHLEAASGVAGLAKALLTLVHRQVPATIGITQLNPAIAFDDLNLDVVTESRALKPEGELVVGVNSFGFGGANAHVILRSYEPTQVLASNSAPIKVPLMLSAKDAAGLAANAQLFAEHLALHPAHGLYNTAYHALLRRDHHALRLVVISAQADEAAQALVDFAADPTLNKLSSVVEYGRALEHASAPVWLFSGNGSQWQGMGKSLLSDATFAAAVAEVDTFFVPLAGYSLATELAGEFGVDRYALTEFAQPALFALQVGIVRMLEKRGIKPAAVMGHSVGEVAAAWACGALTLTDATLVIYQRSRLQGLTRGHGQMAAVGLGAEQISLLIDSLGLEGQLVVAAENSFKGSTIAGPVAALEQIEALLSERQVFVRRLALDYAFHSPAMNPIQQPVIQALSTITPQASRVPFYSTVTGGVLEGESLTAEYWWQNIRHPVLFQSASRGLVEQGFNVFVDIGPHPILRSYVMDELNTHERSGVVIETLLRDDHGQVLIDRTLAKLLIAGIEPQWSALFPVVGSQVRLPNYAWQRERHWHPTTPEALGALFRERVHPLLGYVVPNQALLWENRLDTALFPTLADHKVGDSVLFPGAGFTELALAAALQYQPGVFVDIEELEIHSPLILSAEHSKKVRVSIDDRDGTLQVTSRSTGEAEAWVQHVVARLPGEARGVMLDVQAPMLPARGVDFTRDAHLQLTQSVGLNYGPAYQAVEDGWIENATVLARLSVPDSIEAEMGALKLHPALLDSAFQLITQLLANEPGLRRGLAFIPVKLGRIAFAVNAGVAVLAKVELVKASEHSLLADFSLFDADGLAVVVIKNARFRGVRLQRDRQGDVKLVDTVGVAKPLHRVVGQRVENPVGLLESLQRAVSGLVDEPQLARYVNEVDPLLDSLCNAFFCEAVARLGGAISVAQRAAWSAQNPTLGHFIDRLLTHALAGGSLQVSLDGGWQLAGPLAEPSAQIIWQALQSSYPEHFQIIHSVGRIGTHLEALLKGEIALQDLTPRETSPAALARLVLGAKGYHAMLKGVGEFIAMRLQSLAAGQRLRILELGFSASPLVVTLYQTLDFDRVDYHYCVDDIEAVEWLQADFPSLNVSTFNDARQQAERQSQRYDLILAPTDLAPLDRISQALQFASGCVSDDAQVLLLAQQPSTWADLVFAAQPEWWLVAEGQAALAAHQQPAFWAQELQRHGLQCEQPLEFAPGSACGSYLIVATGSAQPLPNSDHATQEWLLLASNDGPDVELAQALADALRAQGQSVSLLQPQALDAMSSPAQIVMLAGLGHSAGLDAQAERCILAANLSQACEARGINPNLWLLTHGAASHLLGADAVSLDIADAALWGFGRTLANESTHSRVLLLDIPHALSAALLAQALLAGDEETEMALDVHGQRFVPRLRLQPGLWQDGTRCEALSAARLGFDLPGQLRNLRWESRPLPVPAADELDIDVKATGLNFRDVMYALGLLSDEAIENGFSGPTLGFEFAGTVRGKGDDVEGDFAVGDRVVGFGPCSFATSLVTNANAVARIPQGMSFEAAATIPSTFFTVYYALHHLARLEPGEKILIHGAAGGVGIAAIQIARWCGAEIYATAGSDEKRDFLRLMGVEHIFDSRSLSYSDQIMAVTDGRGVDVVLNSLAGEAINRNFQVLKPFGRFLELGKRDFYQNTKIGLRPFRNNISYFGIDADQLMSERPQLTRRLFADMMALFAQGVLSPLPYHEFDANDVEQAFRYMQQARQIGKVVVTYRNPLHSVVQPRVEATSGLQLNPDASYLVTGGLGGFGLRTAQWLVEKGARHLVLLSRRGASSEEAQPMLAAWRETGIDVQALACDLTEAAQLAEVFSELARGPYPLRGVVHAATVIDDGLIRNLDQSQVQRVLAPKAMGAQHLDSLTRDLPLDFFVMYSSATTLFGNPGQASYVAANHWLEALARRRLALGLPATVVLWGAIDDAGFLARNEDIKQALQSRMGGSALKTHEALQNLEQMLIYKRSGLGILELDWKALSRFLPSAQAPKFSELACLGGVEADAESADDIRQLLQLDDEALREAFGELLKQEISEILRLPVSRLDSQRPLQELGLDSLMSVELVVAVEERFGVRLAVMELSESSSIDKLTVRLIELVRGNSHTQQADQHAMARDTLARHGVELSAEQAAQLSEAGNDRSID